MSYKIRYKLTDQNMQTYKGYPWKLNVWQEPIGDSQELCAPGLLHGYIHPLVAVLMNPIHANIINPRLFKCEVKGEHLDDHGLKEGWKFMRLVEEIPVPDISLIQEIAFGILCALEVFTKYNFVQWAEDWLSGKDRRAKSASRIVFAAEYATLNGKYSTEYAALAAEYSAHSADESFARFAAKYAALAAAEYAVLAREKINLIHIAKQAMKVK